VNGWSGGRIVYCNGRPCPKVSHFTGEYIVQYLLILLTLAGIRSQTGSERISLLS